MASSSVPTRPTTQPPRGLRNAALALLGVAVLLALWVTSMSLRAGPVPGCDGGECGAVLASKWAKLFGVPVGVFGAASYAILALLGARPFRAGQEGARLLGRTLVVLIPAAALWFVALQLFVVRAFCPWCTATHAVATVGAILMALAWRQDNAAPVGRKEKARAGTTKVGWAMPVGVALAALAGFAGAQSLSPEPPARRLMTASMEASPTNPPPASGTQAVAAASASSPIPAVASTNAASAAPDPAQVRQLTLHGGRFVLDAGQFPVFGKPEAPAKVLMISDYTCRHCRAAHKLLEEVKGTFGDRLAFVMLPSHHGGDSEQLQRMLLTAWKLNPAVWRRMADDLYSERVPLQPDTVRAQLQNELGIEPFKAAMVAEEAWVNRMFAQAREIAQANRARTGSGSIPQFIIGTEIIVGAPADSAEVFDLLAKHLGLRRDVFPLLQVGVPEVELGRVFAGTTLGVKIPVSNPGRAPLRVQRAQLPPGSRPGAGFNVPIAPGATSTVEVVFAVPREDGPFAETVTLVSNAETSSVPVLVKGLVHKPLKLTPEILDLGRFDPSRGSTSGVMRVELSEPARLTAVRSRHPGFTAQLREVTPNQVYEVEVTAGIDLPVGQQQTALLVTVAQPVPQGWPETIALGARVTVERRVTVSPNRLVIPRGKLADDRHHQVLVRAGDGLQEFAVTDAVLEGGPAFVRPEIQKPGGNRDHTVTVTLPAGWTMPASATAVKLVIYTNHPEAPTVEVPIVPQVE